MKLTYLLRISQHNSFRDQDLSAVYAGDQRNFTTMMQIVFQDVVDNPTA